MRILHIIPRYYPAVGGAERYMAAVSERLVLQGHKVTVATSTALDFDRIWRPEGRTVERSTGHHNGVLIYYFPVRYLPFPKQMYPALRLLTGLITRLFGENRLTHRLIRCTPSMPAVRTWLADPAQRGRFDLVAGMGITFEGLMAEAAHFSQRENIPFLLYPLVHLGAGPGPGKDPLSRFYTLPQQNSLAGQADAILAMTPSEMSYYRSVDIPDERLFLTGPGIDIHQAAPGNGRRWREKTGVDSPIVLAVGSQTTDKGIPDLIRACQRLWREEHDVALVLAGNISQTVKTMCDRLGKTDRQRLFQLGPVTEETKNDLLDAADIFCLPSRTDSFGIVYLEAWLYQKPVIAAATWGIQSDVVEDGRDGLIVPFGEPRAIAAAIKRLLDQPELSRALGRAGYEKVLHKHTWEKKFPAIADVYRQFNHRIAG